jgi:branched-chain amino acid transport system substrate-binding protein
MNSQRCRHFIKLAIMAIMFAATTTAQAEIQIGVAGPMSGQNAALGEQMKRGAEAAVADINAKGGINGEALSLQIGDDQCDAKRAVAVANAFAATDVRMVVGHYCSGAALAAAPIYAERDVLMITPSASHPKLTDQTSSTTLRLASRDDAQGELAALRIRQDNAQAIVAVIDDGLQISKLIASRFAARFPPALSLSIKPGERNYAAIVAQMTAKGITAVYFACGGIEAGMIAAELRTAGRFARLYGADGLLVDSFWEQSAEAGESTLVTFPVDATVLPSARELVARLRSDGGTAESVSIASYAAIQVFAAAMTSRSLGKASDLAIWLKSGNEIETMLGAVKFDAKGDVVPQRFEWYKWTAGTYAPEVLSR